VIFLLQVCCRIFSVRIEAFPSVPFFSGSSSGPPSLFRLHKRDASGPSIFFLEACLPPKFFLQSACRFLRRRGILFRHHCAVAPFFLSASFLSSLWVLIVLQALQAVAGAPRAGSLVTVKTPLTFRSLLSLFHPLTGKTAVHCTCLPREIATTPPSSFKLNDIFIYRSWVSDCKFILLYRVLIL